MPRRKKSSVIPRKPLVPGSRGFAYCRDSGGGRQEKSIRDQVQEITQYANRHGWIITRWFIDEARSGGQVDSRDAFQDMLVECQQPTRPADFVVVWDFSRFGRGNELDSQFYKAVIRRLGIEVVSVTDVVPDGPFGPLIEIMIDVQNNMFLDKLSEFVKRGLRTNAKDGYAHGGRPPLGYMRQPERVGTHRDGTPRIASRWVPDPLTADKVRLAFQMFANGASYAAITAATGIERPKASWNAMFRSPTYRGVLKCGESEFPDAWEALCDQATWQRIQERIMVGKQPQAKPESQFLLSGIVECGYCGGPVSGGTDMRNARREESHGHGKPWRYYRCTNRKDGRPCEGQARTPADLLEGRVREAVLSSIYTENNVRDLLAELQQRLAGGGLQEEIAGLNRRIAQAKAAIENILDGIEQGILSSDEARDRMQKRRGELAGYELDLAALLERRATAELVLDDDNLRVVIAGLRANTQSDDINIARKSLRAVIAKVVLYRDEFQIEYDPDLLVQELSGMPPRRLEPYSCITVQLREQVRP